MNKNRFRGTIRSVCSQALHAMSRWKQCTTDNLLLISLIFPSWQEEYCESDVSVNHHNTPKHRCSRADSIRRVITSTHRSLWVCSPSCRWWASPHGSPWVPFISIRVIDHIQHRWCIDEAPSVSISYLLTLSDAFRPASRPYRKSTTKDFYTRKYEQ